MGRGLTGAVQAAIAADHVVRALLIELQFPSGTLRFTDNATDLEWDGETWLGAGSVSAIEPVSETAEIGAAVLNVKFSGIPTEYVAAVLDDHYQGNPAILRLAFCDPDSWAILSDPVVIFQGRMDEPQITMDDKVAEIVIALENRFADWDRPRLRMFNDAEQQLRYPGDRFFEYVAQVESTSYEWGLYKGPAAPDPLKVLNRTVDRVVDKINPLFLGLPKPTVQIARKVGDFVSNVFGGLF